MSGRGGWETLRARLAREQAILVSLALLYFVTGRLGFSFAFRYPEISLIWAPSGLALGAFIILGYRIWPIILGSGVVLYGSMLGATPLALWMAGANTCEGLLAAYLVNRYAEGRHALQSPRNSLRFAGVVLLATMTVSGPLNALGLIAAGRAYWSDYGMIWFAQTLASSVGMVLVGPLVVLFSQGSITRWRPREVLEGVAAFLAVVLVGVAVFCRVPAQLRGLPSEMLCMPVLLWVSFRLGRRASAAAVIVLAALAVGGTLSGYGPFVRSTPFASLSIVQMFIGITSVVTLALAALVSEYASAEAQLRELVVTDPLTGLPNYRRLLEVLSMEISRADRHDRPFAVVFFDMDSLKYINDEHGHLVGSRAVCRFAETLRAACRASDTAARYGGDEFVAVLSDTNLEGAKVVVQRVHERLAEDPDHPMLSVSAGVAIYPRDGGTPTTLLSAADRALYAVKAEKANTRWRQVVGLREWSSVGSR